MLKKQFSGRKLTSVFRAALLKPTPPLIVFPQNVFQLVDIQMHDLLPLLKAK